MRCLPCGRELSPTEAVYRYIDFVSNFGWPSRRLVWACAHCFKKRFSNPWIDRIFETECLGCGRPLVFYGERALRSQTCNERCRITYYVKQAKMRRTMERDVKVCPQCQRVFKPRRIDSRYCSNVCRQAAYRVRRSVEPLTA
jgi:hypothetical protein